jgi:two-component system sensor histidine kinase TctE
MVALVEAQAVQITALKAAVESLEARMALRGALDTVVLEQVREPVEDLLAGLRKLHEAPDHHLAEQTLQRGEQLAVVLEQLLTPPEVAPVSLDRNELQPVNLRELIGKALTLLRGAGTVTIDVPPGLFVNTSAARLVAMVNALVDNALRHGSEPIDVWAQPTPDGDVEIHVADRGPGLNGLDAAEFFHRPMPQATDAGTFGLYLVYRLAASLGGDVALVDRPGGGAIATLRIPQRRDGDPRE